MLVGGHWALQPGVVFDLCEGWSVKHVVRKHGENQVLELRREVLLSFLTEKEYFVIILLLGALSSETGDQLRIPDHTRQLVEEGEEIPQ